MSVYKPEKSRFYHFDFQYQGRRFHGSTGVETQRKAEAIERLRREQAASGTFGADQGLTLDQAAGRWWLEVGRDLRDAERLKPRIQTLLRLLGRATPITEIRTRHIARAIERRRGETYQRAPDRPAEDGRPARKARRYPVANATVNAELVNLLRRILTRAGKVWEVKGLPAIDWKALRLPEPEPEIRIYTEAQRDAWLAECDDAARKPLEMLLTYGLRFGELFFPPQAYLPEGPYLAIDKRKRGALLLPLREDDSREIAARVGIAAAAGLDTVWFEQGRKGELIPLTRLGLQARLRSAARRAGIDLPRVIHGCRHHVGTTVLALTGDLRLTGKALGHADLKSTLRYAHALDGGLRAVFEMARDSHDESSQTDFTVPEQARGRRARRPAD